MEEQLRYTVAMEVPVVDCEDDGIEYVRVYDTVDADEVFPGVSQPQPEPEQESPPPKKPSKAKPRKKLTPKKKTPKPAPPPPHNPLKPQTHKKPHHKHPHIKLNQNQKQPNKHPHIKLNQNQKQPNKHREHPNPHNLNQSKLDQNQLSQPNPKKQEGLDLRGLGWGNPHW
ncbi:pollen-specific leucine-rich repeat extensin-like protein 1 [Spinacia oleracea]|uniref:Pollen-specific leucine-rich repeat extensin-like protein 1 n=1 Tax=Spinacia oleracea TaxID=3562 RepID=A0ABM3RPK3_SPIOL|nr:pollen-specific leucine-rich repeat extensin-like protein 1 [Spinacia oleracea]